MVDQENIMITRAAIQEMQALSAAELSTLTAFLRKLQKNPYDPDLMSETEAHGDIFASTVGKNDVYWTIESRDEGADTLKASHIVRLLALKQAAKPLRLRSGANSRLEEVAVG